MKHIASIVTADLGELFGEDGRSGHGPAMRETCFSIPCVEGRSKEANPVG